MILAEIIPSKPGGLPIMANVKEVAGAFNSGKGFEHPVLDRFKANADSGPSLYFDMQKVEQRMDLLAEVARPFGVTPLLAVKSFPDERCLGSAQRKLGGFDISNPVEYACLPNNLNDKLVSIVSPEMDFDISGFVSKGNAAVVVLDSFTQLDRYFSQQPGIPYMLRVQSTHLVENTNPAYYQRTRFGFSLEEVGQALKHPKVIKNPPAGFHVHHGSETNQITTFQSMIKSLASLARELQVEPKFINLGGGWGKLTPEEIRTLLAEARKTFPLPCSILMEPGHWYSKDTGFAVCTVVNQMQSIDTINYTVNISKRAHLRWSDVNLIAPIESQPRKAQRVQFFGPSCFEGDLIGNFIVPYHSDFSHESGLIPGQQVVFSNVNCYSVAWNASFNGVARAKVNPI